MICFSILFCTSLSAFGGRTLGSLSVHGIIKYNKPYRAFIWWCDFTVSLEPILVQV